MSDIFKVRRGHPRAMINALHNVSFLLGPKEIGGWALRQKGTYVQSLNIMAWYQRGFDVVAHFQRVGGRHSTQGLLGGW